MTVKEFYEKVGANYSEVLERLMNDALVSKFIKKFAEDDSVYKQLESSIAAGDYETAFRASHTLKGVVLNLSLTNLATPLIELTEDLRAGGSAKAPELFDAVKTRYKETMMEIGELD